MKASSIIGIVVGCLGIAMGATMEGSNIMAVINPSAMLIVLVGTLGATITGTSFDSIKAIPKLYKKAFSPDVLEAENDAMRKRHKACTQPFEKAGGYAPTLGIIGTVFGLVHVLSNLSAPETLGPSISAAFIATLIGISSANLVYLPVAARLKQLSEEELHFREMTLEGILAIQAGDNPRVVQEKLTAYIPPAMRMTEEEAAAAAQAQKAAA